MSYLIYRKNGSVPIRIVHRDPHIITSVMESTFKQEYGSQYVEMDECLELAALRDRLTKADEIISMIDAAVSRDEIESVKSRALEYVREYKVEA